MTLQTKHVKAVAPFRYPDAFNFKMPVYEAWIRMGGKDMPSHYPSRKFHALAYRYDLPSLYKKKSVAQLRFVQPLSVSFDAFPGYVCYEIIPLVWDCWPMYFEKTCRWFEKHQIRTAIFTSTQTAARMKERFPEMNILTITEGIDTDMFEGGNRLSDRVISLYEIGSIKRGLFRKKYPEEYKKLFTKPKDWGFSTQKDYKRLLQNSRLTVIFPRSITEPDIAGGIETLTQRYWECMLSRIVMVGHAPKELVDLVGYNPVIEMDMEHDLEQVNQILSGIGSPVYQEMVDRNRETALRMGSWDLRMRQVMEWLKGLGYEV
jgi:hypothetical protein